MTEKLYFQYPLCAAAYGHSEDERMKAIIAYCAVQLGAREWTKLNEIERAKFLSTVQQLPGFDSEDARHCGAAYGMTFMGLQQEAPGKLLETHDLLSQFITDRETKWGRDAKVRVRRDILLAARYGNLRSEHFCVFGAILSLIGTKTFGWGTLPMLRARALGYKSNSVMNGSIGERRDGQQPMSNDQLGNSIAFLHARKFFACVVKDDKSFFSIRLDPNELERLVNVSTQRQSNAPIQVGNACKKAKPWE